MGGGYQTTGKNCSRELAKVLAANGQVILPMVELIEECEVAVDHSRVRSKIRDTMTRSGDSRGSLREGLEEMFTIKRLGLPASLRRSLAATNIIESPHSGVRMRTRRVANWQGGSMVPRWAASGFLATEKSFRRTMGYRDSCVLAAALGRHVDRESIAA